MPKTQIPPETVQVFRQRPLGLRLGSRNGVIYVYGVDKVKPSSSNVLQDMHYKKLLDLIGLRVLRVQEIDVKLYSLTELSELINTEKFPLYITFGEDIGIFEDLENKKFDPDLHLSYFQSMWKRPPSQYVAMDVQRMTLLFFSIFAIDLLCDVDSYFNSSEIKKQERNDIIEWIYAQQMISSNKKNNKHGGNNKYGGFRGGSFLGISYKNNSLNDEERVYLNKYDRVNMASTHNAICVLIGLGDDLSRLDRNGIINTLKALQNPTTGAFASMIDGEVDLRFIYCACVVSHLMNDWSGINIENATKYIMKCQSYDGSLAFDEHLEGHGGATFVGIASLVLMNKLHVIDIDALLRWCIFNQGDGFKGRPEKPCDSCYSFWIGAVLSMLSSYKEQLNDENDDENKCNDNNDNEEDKKLLNGINLDTFYHSSDKQFYNMCCHRYNRIFNLLCQSGFGGFAKLPHIHFGDILHGYMGLAGLSLMSHNFKELNTFSKYPNLFKKTLFPITSSTISYKNIAKNMQKKNNNNDINKPVINNE